MYLNCKYFAKWLQYFCIHIYDKFKNFVDTNYNVIKNNSLALEEKVVFEEIINSVSNWTARAVFEIKFVYISYDIQCFCLFFFGLYESNFQLKYDVFYRYQYHGMKKTPW